MENGAKVVGIVPLSRPMHPDAQSGGIRGQFQHPDVFFFVEKPSCLFGWTVSSSAFASEAGGVSWPMPACTHTELHLEMVLDFQPTYSSFLTSHSIRASLMYEYRDLRHLLRSPESVPLVSVRPHTSIYCHHQRKERRTNSDPKRAQPCPAGAAIAWTAPVGQNKKELSHLLRVIGLGTK